MTYNLPTFSGVKSAEKNNQVGSSSVASFHKFEKQKENLLKLLFEKFLILET